MADQELGQGARKHQLALGLGNEGIAQSLEPEPGLARFADGVVEVSTAAGICTGAAAGETECRAQPVWGWESELFPDTCRPCAV